jgi:LysM repeat protein
MKKAALIILLFIVTSISGFSLSAQNIEKSELIETIDGRDYYLHFVKPGETLFAIARAYDITVNEIFKLNPESGKGISQGDVLKIPVKEAFMENSDSEPGQDESGSPYFYHIVKKQETLFGIAKKYGTSIDAILKINPQMGEYPKEGETIRIPRAIKETETTDSWSGSQTSHIVSQGETLYGIAKRYNISLGEIQNANPGLPEVLPIGF